MSQARHARPRRRAAVRPVVVGATVIAVGASGALAAYGMVTGDTPAGAAAAAPSVDPVAEAARLAAAERASRAEERAHIKAAQTRAKKRLREIRERAARLERERRERERRQACARADAVLADLGLTAEQRRNVAIIVETARRMGLPPRAAVVGVAAAWQESHLQNLNYGLGDSIGMFQQRPSMGWGSNSQLRNPYYSTRKFFERLADTPGWQHMSVGGAAQAVQASAYPRAYDRWVDSAREVVRALEPLGKAHIRCS